MYTWYTPERASVTVQVIFSHPYVGSVSIGLENVTKIFVIVGGVTSQVNKEHLDEIISAAHIDETCRPQTVEKETCASYYKLIDNFRGITGVPAILNTSFNFRGEPLVCDPRDALRTYFSTGMDYLVLENFLIKKQ
jgi:predicted NodU family carbamoyl transferase